MKLFEPASVDTASGGNWVNPLALRPEWLSGCVAHHACRRVGAQQRLGHLGVAASTTCSQLSSTSMSCFLSGAGVRDAFR